MSDIERTEKGHPMDGLMPVLIADKLSMARTLHDSGMIPRSLDTPAKVFIALQMGHELGLKPMVAVNNISAINGKPVIGTDLMVGLAKQHPDYRGMTVNYVGEGEHLRCDVSIKRAIHTGNTEFVEESLGSFSIQDAHDAGLMSKDPWKKYPRRMLKHRASSFAIRDAFSDVLAGLHTAEEVQGEDFNEQPRNVTPAQPGAHTQNGDMIVQQIADSIEEQIDKACDEGVIDQVEAAELGESLEKYKAQGASKLTDFRRFLNARLAEKKKGNGKKKGPKEPKQEVEDAETEPGTDTGKTGKNTGKDTGKTGKNTGTEDPKATIGAKGSKVEGAITGGKESVEQSIGRMKEKAEEEQGLFPDQDDSDLGDEIV